MAKAKYWLVRTNDGQYVVLFKIDKPRLPLGGWAATETTMAKRDPWPEFPCERCVRILLPKQFHLKPGGGPVELKG